MNVVGRSIAIAFAVFLTVSAAPGAAEAALWEIRQGEPVQEAVDASAPGDVIRLEAGDHQGPVSIDRSLILEGEPGAVLDGGDSGSVVSILAPDVTVRGLTVRGSGSKLHEMDSGIFVGREAHRALVEGNRLDGNLFGIYLWGPDDATVRANIITGRQVARVSETGSGVAIWSSPGSRVLDNDIRFGADGIFVKTSKRNVFDGNRMRDLRFAVHYMYTNDSQVTNNVSIGNDIGYAIMFSHRLEVSGNLSERDRDHGFMFNYANYSDVKENVVRLGGEKCVFIYNANFNEFRRNWFEGCGIGIHFTAGSESNEISGNAFVGNESQVKYVGTSFVDWSSEGRGNFWSDNPAFDLDGDGIADSAYRPNDIIDQVLWTNPSAKILVTSPAVQVIRWAQAQFPAIQPGGVIDSAPLIAPPEISIPAFAP
jgi:nitrous oxidase accessory protein